MADDPTNPNPPTDPATPPPVDPAAAAAAAAPPADPVPAAAPPAPPAVTPVPPPAAPPAAAAPAASPKKPPDAAALRRLAAANADKTQLQKVKALGFDSLEAMAEAARKAEEQRVAGLSESQQSQEKVAVLERQVQQLTRQNQQLRQRSKQSDRRLAHERTERDVKTAFATAGIQPEHMDYAIHAYQCHVRENPTTEGDQMDAAAFVETLRAPKFYLFGTAKAPPSPPASTAPAEGTPPAETPPAAPGDEIVDNLKDKDFQKRTQDKYGYKPGVGAFG